MKISNLKTKVFALEQAGAAAFITAAILTAALLLSSYKPSADSVLPEYTPVAYAKLADYLQKLPVGTTVYKIEVTGLTAADLKGGAGEISPLGKILKDNNDKKVALKLGGDIAGLTDMSFCFRDCTNLVQVTAIPAGVTNMRYCFAQCACLTQAPVIPQGVTNMSSCFESCNSLTQAPEIPESVTDMRRCFQHCTKLKSAVLKCNYTPGKFGFAFANCTDLTEGSIKIPALQLQTYKNNANKTGAQDGWFAEEQV